MMGRPELGTKCTCTGCGERFYDLRRTPPVCPKCGAEQPPEKPRPVRPVRSPTGTRYPARPPAPVVADDELDPVSTSDTDEEDEDPVEPEDETDDDADVEISPARDKPAD